MIPFSKMHGIGNDFVVVDRVAKDLSIEDPGLLARKMCDRHFGIGADGLILVDRGDHAPFRMTMFNPDGTNGGMCGNGVRCTARLLLERGHQGPVAFFLEVEHRLVEVEPVRLGWVKVNMGRAALTRGEIGMLGSPSEEWIEVPMDVDGVSYKGTAVSMGNPHLVLFVDEPDAIDLAKVGPILEHHPLFPFRTNAHFAKPERRDSVRMRTWERGAGATLACGSGACAVAVAAAITGRTEGRTTITLPGGELEVEYRADHTVLMEGPAELSFEGQWIDAQKESLVSETKR